MKILLKMKRAQRLKLAKNTRKIKKKAENPISSKPSKSTTIKVSSSLSLTSSFEERTVKCGHQRP